MNWTNSLPPLAAQTAQRLSALPIHRLPKAAVLFRAGEAAQGFVIVLKGRIEVMLTGPSGREILLYAVEPGQSCVQTTLGLLGDETYTGEAFTASEVEAVLIPKAMFLHAMDSDPGFRGFVLRAFGARMADLTRVLEQVAFGRIEARLAALLLDRAVDNRVSGTQAELAARIGSAREVVTRKLDAFASKGWIETERGHVTLKDLPALRQLARAL